MNGTKTIDVPCWTCKVAAGVRCLGKTFCQSRRNDAANKTRVANLIAKKNGKP